MVKCYVIEEIGTVKSVDGIMAVVYVPRKSACDGCTAGTCKVEEQFMEIEALNKAGAKVGQKVRVAVQSVVFMKGSMLVYGLPALGLVIGAVFGKEVMARFYPAADPDILSAVFGFCAFGVSLVIVKIWSNRVGKDTSTKPVIEEIVAE